MASGGIESVVESLVMRAERAMEEAERIEGAVIEGAVIEGGGGGVGGEGGGVKDLVEGAEERGV